MNRETMGVPSANMTLIEVVGAVGSVDGVGSVVSESDEAGGSARVLPTPWNGFGESCCYQRAFNISAREYA